MNSAAHASQKSKPNIGNMTISTAPGSTVGSAAVNSTTIMLNSNQQVEQQQQRLQLALARHDFVCILGLALAAHMCSVQVHTELARVVKLQVLLLGHGKVKWVQSSSTQSQYLRSQRHEFA